MRNSCFFCGLIFGSFYLYLILFFKLLSFPFFQTLQENTKGWISPILVGAGIANFLFCFLFLKVGHFSLRSLGLKREKFFVGVFFTFVIWGFSQIAFIVESYLSNQSIVWNPDWWHWRYVFGDFVAQILGNALLEEVIFHGFLLIQFRIFFEKCSLRYAQIFALVLSQILFALAHIPGRVYMGVYHNFSVAFGEQCFLFLLGILWSLLFLRTQNIFIVIGVHALNNTPVALFVFEATRTETTSGWIKLFTLLLLICWPIFSSSFLIGAQKE